MASVVYFIQAIIGGPIKIGLARDVTQRVAALQIGCPFRLQVLCTMPGERRQELSLHRRFEALCHGHEWFRPEGALVEFIASLGGTVFPTRSWAHDAPLAVAKPMKLKVVARTALGVRFSEGHRLTWIGMAALKLTPTQMRRRLLRVPGGDQPITSSMWFRILFGDRRPGRWVAEQCRVQFNVPIEAWFSAPTEPFVRPLDAPESSAPTATA